MLSEKLRRLMEGREHGDVAREAGITPSAISNYINGKSSPRVEIALSLAKVFGCSLEWLVDDSREWEGRGQQSDFDLMKEACRRLAAHADAVRKQNAELRKIPWAEVADQMLNVPVDDPLPVKFDAAVEALMKLQKSLDSLDRFDASKMLSRYIDNAPDIGDLKDVIKDLKSETDIARSLKYMELRDLSIALRRHGSKSSDRDLDGHRKRLLAGDGKSKSKRMKPQ